MSTSAVNSTCSPSSILVTSMSGWLTGKMSLSSTAWPYSLGTASLRVSSSTTARPKRCSMIRAGTLPGRNPGTRTCCATFLYAACRLSPSSSNGTSTVSFTRVGLSSSTAVFTGWSP